MNLIPLNKIKKLNTAGVSHLVVPVVVVVGIAAIGTYTYVASHADSLSNLVCSTSASHIVYNTDGKGDLTAYVTENFTNTGPAKSATAATYVSLRKVSTINLTSIAGPNTDVTTHSVPALKGGQKYSAVLALQYYRNTSQTHSASIVVSSRTPVGVCTPAATTLSINAAVVAVPPSKTTPSPTPTPTTVTALSTLTDLLQTLIKGGTANVTASAVTIPGPKTDATGQPLVFTFNGVTYFAYNQGTAPNFDKYTPAQLAASFALVKATVNNPALSPAHVDKNTNLVDANGTAVGFSTGGN